MDTNLNAEFILELNQKIRDLIFKENIPLLQELIQKYNFLYQPIDANNLTALHVAVQMDKKKVILMLCELLKKNNPPNETEIKGINMPDIMGRTPLHQAGAKGSIDIILNLIKYGANVNAQTISGETPLMKAIAFYQEKACKILLRYGADPNMENSVTNKNCLRQAYESGNSEIINTVKVFSEKYSNYIKMILKIADTNNNRKNYLQKIPNFLLLKAINYIIP